MSPMKVSMFLAVGICLFAISVYAEGATENEDDENTIKVYKRLIPADVLRGLCLNQFHFCCILFLIFDFCC